MVVKGIDDTDELSTALVAFEAVALKSAAIHQRKTAPLKPQSRGAFRAADELLGFRYRVCFIFSHDEVHANVNNTRVDY